MTKPTAGAAVDPAELEQHRGYLLQFARHHARDPGVAEDLVQETYAAAIASLHRFEGRSALRTWLTRILLNKLADHYRERTHEVSLDEGDGDLEEFFQANGHYVEMPRPWRDPDEALTEERFYEVLQLCIDGLSQNAARVFLLRELMGLTIEEVCKELGISESNCSVMLHRSRQRLRACLERRWFYADRPRQGSSA